MCSGIAGCSEYKCKSKNSKRWGRRYAFPVTLAVFVQKFTCHVSGGWKTPVPLLGRWQTVISSGMHGPIFTLKRVSLWKINYLVTLGMVLLQSISLLLKKKMFKKKQSLFFSGLQCAIRVAWTGCNHLVITLPGMAEWKDRRNLAPWKYHEPLNQSTLKSPSVQSSCYLR